MTKKRSLFGLLLGASLLLLGCQKAAVEGLTSGLTSSAEAPEKSPADKPEEALASAEVEGSKPESGAEKVAKGVDTLAEPPPGAAPKDGLPETCQKLLTCCDAWTKVTPSAEVGCNAQRNAFRAAKTPEAKAGLSDLCEQALLAWAQLTDIPSVCK